MHTLSIFLLAFLFGFASTVNQLDIKALEDKIFKAGAEILKPEQTWDLLIKLQKLYQEQSDYKRNPVLPGVVDNLLKIGTIRDDICKNGVYLQQSDSNSQLGFNVEPFVNVKTYTKRYLEQQVKYCLDQVSHEMQQMDEATPTEAKHLLIELNKRLVKKSTFEELDPNKLNMEETFIPKLSLSIAEVVAKHNPELGPLISLKGGDDQKKVYEIYYNELLGDTCWKIDNVLRKVIIATRNISEQQLLALPDSFSDWIIYASLCTSLTMNRANFVDKSYTYWKIVREHPERVEDIVIDNNLEFLQPMKKKNKSFWSKMGKTLHIRNK